MTLLQVALSVLFVVDTGLFLLAQSNPGFYVTNIPFWSNAADQGQYSRLVGSFFLLLGIAKLHGALHLHEKVSQYSCCNSACSCCDTNVVLGIE